MEFNHFAYHRHSVGIVQPTTDHASRTTRNDDSHIPYRDSCQPAATVQIVLSERGLTLIQWIICVAIVTVIGVFSIPKWLEYRRVSQAVIDTQMLAEACRKYARDTGEFPQRFEQLMQNPQVTGWRGPYLESIPKTPWGGDYILLTDKFKVAIPSSVQGVPEKYRLGQVAEISAVYKEGASWW